MPLDPYPGSPSPNTLADASTLRLQLDELFNPPAARVYHAANQSIADSTSTALALNSELFDNDAIHDNATNNSRLTCKTAGVYVITAVLQWGVNGTRVRSLGIRMNGTTFLSKIQRQALDTAQSGIEDEQETTTIYKLAVNDYVETVVWQNSGGALDVKAAGCSPHFGMAWVSTG